MSFYYLKEIKVYKRGCYNFSMKIKCNNDSKGWYNSIKKFDTEEELKDYINYFIHNYNEYDMVVVPFSQASRLLDYSTDVEKFLYHVKNGFELCYLKKYDDYIYYSLSKNKFEYTYRLKTQLNKDNNSNLLFTEKEIEKIKKDFYYLELNKELA